MASGAAESTAAAAAAAAAASRLATGNGGARGEASGGARSEAPLSERPRSVIWRRSGEPWPWPDAEAAGGGAGGPLGRRGGTAAAAAAAAAGCASVGPLSGSICRGTGRGGQGRLPLGTSHLPYPTQGTHWVQIYRLPTQHEGPDRIRQGGPHPTPPLPTWTASASTAPAPKPDSCTRKGRVVCV